MSESEWIEVQVLPVSQPIGNFYVGVMPASSLVGICKTDVRRLQGKAPDSSSPDLIAYIGIQRPLREDRVKEIKEYVKTIDACFPNSIIIAIPSENVEVVDGRSAIKILNKPDVATVIDGQHRLAGFSENPGVGDFGLLTSIFVDLEIAEQAYLFSTINSKQTKINPSLAKDLLDFSNIQTPEKVCHNIAKLLNTTPGGPWDHQIRMLGVKDEIVSGIITQHTFVSKILDVWYPAKDLQQKVRDMLIDENNKRENLGDLKVDTSRYPLWELYITDQDELITKILDNYFRAVRDTWPEFWARPESILSKSVGYQALMSQFPVLLKRGFESGVVSKEFFMESMKKARVQLEASGKQPTGRYYGSSAAEANRLWKDMFGER